MPRRRSYWLDAIAAVAGGLALGIGLTRMVLDFSLLACVIAVIGFLILWWVLADARVFRRGNPESDDGGTRTIE
ncbi:MAG TPA: hypothetical protein VFI91_00430 [Longimicrobiaceae bacterium]|nr:hypothetical protein [Longimicrobiaceae bacterium]